MLTGDVTAVFTYSYLY